MGGGAAVSCLAFGSRICKTHGWLNDYSNSALPTSLEHSSAWIAGPLSCRPTRTHVPVMGWDDGHKAEKLAAAVGRVVPLDAVPPVPR